MQITFNDTPLNLVPDTQHEFLLSNKEVALAYGIKLDQLTQAKRNHPDALIEGKHYVRIATQTAGGKQKVIHWTKRGIVRLGFFIKSKEAAKFRDWAEDYIVNDIVNSNTDEIDDLKKIIMAQNKLIASKPEIHPKSELTPSDHNTMLDMVYQFTKADHEITVLVNKLATQHLSITNFLNYFKSKYPECSAYADKCKRGFKTN